MILQNSLYDADLLLKKHVLSSVLKTLCCLIFFVVYFHDFNVQKYSIYLKYIYIL